MNERIDPSTVGLIGIGLLGTAIAERLIAAGFNVIGFDNNDQQRDGFKSLGGQAVDSGVAVAKRCARIVLSLPDSDVVRAVISKLSPELPAVTTIIDTTTGDPGATVHLVETLAVQGVAYVDATIAGSSEQVRRGEVLALVGGTAESYETCEDILDAFAARRFHVGPAGDGARMKLVVNLVLGLHRAVLAEALTFGESFGFSSQRVLEMLRASPAYSRVMDTKGDKMVRRDFVPQARLRQHLKDVRLILAAGELNQAQLPLSKLHAEILQSLVDLGFAEEDNSAVLRAFVRDDAGGFA